MFQGRGLPITSEVSIDRKTPVLSLPLSQGNKTMTVEGIHTTAPCIIKDVQKSILVERSLIPPVYTFKLVDLAFLNTLYRSVLEVVVHAQRSFI